MQDIKGDDNVGFENYVECKVCGSMFMKFGKTQICTKCMDKEEEYFIKVKDYLYDYPSATVEEVSEQTDVDEAFIKYWVDNGRLERAGLAMTFPCEMCGRPIHIGRICKKCQEGLGNIADEIRGQSKGKEELGTNKMYIIEKMKK